MKIYNDFIGNDDSNTTLKFIPGDGETQFKENASKQSDDWYYHNIDITYSFNNLGYRCSDFDKIDQNNYILFTGCSHTMGVGLELEKTYPYLLSKQLGMDYYNLSIPASGMDMVEYNLLSWLFKVPKKPKLIVIQWPDHSRFVEYDSTHNHVLCRGSWQTDPKYISFITNSEDIGLANARKAMTYNLLQNNIKIPMVTLNFGSQQGYGIYDLTMPRIDRARDLSHAGIKSHATFTETLINHIEVNKLIKLAKYNI
jgi:hypothetical protein